MNLNQKNLEKMQEEQLQEKQLQDQIDQIENIAKQYLSKEALSRYNNLKLAHKEKAMQITIIIAQAAQAGQLKRKLTDEELKNLLRELDQNKKEFKIRK